MTVPSFPPGFLWGASASAFRTEGAADTRGTRRPTSAGPSFPTACARPSSSSTTASATGSRRSTSPRTAVPSTSPPRTPAASPTWKGTCGPCARPSTRVSTCALLHLVAHRQCRVDRGRQQALRPGPHRLRDTAPDPQGLVREDGGRGRQPAARRGAARRGRDDPRRAAAPPGMAGGTHPPHSDQMDAFLVDAMTGPRERGCHRRVAPVGGAARG